MINAPIYITCFSFILLFLLGAYHVACEILVLHQGPMKWKLRVKSIDHQGSPHSAFLGHDKTQAHGEQITGGQGVWGAWGGLLGDTRSEVVVASHTAVPSGGKVVNPARGVMEVPGFTSLCHGCGDKCRCSSVVVFHNFLGV